MVQNFKLTLEYDGGAYHGWQKQKHERTIQGEIEKALQTMTGSHVSLIGSGRTDAGVHAFAQVANFRCETRLNAATFLGGLNHLTPKDIIITACKEVNPAFHARFDAKSKVYHYQILNRTMPAAIGRQYAWFVLKKLDLTTMRNALKHLIGQHDFKAFEGAGSPQHHTVRNVMVARIHEKEKGYLVFKIEANGFLRFMVRNIVGTLIDVGLKKISPDEVKRILLSKDRDQAGITAPAHGLFLMKVMY